MFLVAPAGYGKTTLARQWLNGDLDPTPGIWPRRHPLTPRPRGGNVTDGVGFRAASWKTTRREGSRLSPTRLRTLSPRRLISRRTSKRWPSDARFVIDDYHFWPRACRRGFVETLVNEARVPFLITSRTRPSRGSLRGRSSTERQPSSAECLGDDARRGRRALPREVRGDARARRPRGRLASRHRPGSTRTGRLPCGRRRNSGNPSRLLRRRALSADSRPSSAGAFHNSRSPLHFMRRLATSSLPTSGFSFLEEGHRSGFLQQADLRRMRCIHCSVNSCGQSSDDFGHIEIERGSHARRRLVCRRGPVGRRASLAEDSGSWI